MDSPAETYRLDPDAVIVALEEARQHVREVFGRIPKHERYLPEYFPGGKFDPDAVRTEIARLHGLDAVRLETVPRYKQKENQ